VEFRCRVATTTGQILETTYVAESESRLRSELEDKGLFLLSVQRSGGVGLGNVRLRRPRRRRVPTSDFLVFNQELATLLKAGLPFRFETAGYVINGQVISVVLPPSDQAR